MKSLYAYVICDTFINTTPVKFRTSIFVRWKCWFQTIGIVLANINFEIRRYQISLRTQKIWFKFNIRSLIKMFMNYLIMIHISNSKKSNSTSSYFNSIKTSILHTLNLSEYVVNLCTSQIKIFEFMNKIKRGQVTHIPWPIHGRNVNPYYFQATLR